MNPPLRPISVRRPFHRLWRAPARHHAPSSLPQALRGTVARRGGLLALCLLLLVVPGAPAGELRVGEFSAGRLEGWQPEQFKGETRYALVERDGKTVLEGLSRGTASGLLKRMEIDLARYPFLNWSWQAARLPAGAAEKAREGDDFAGRLYVLISGGLLFWRTRALVYVWAREQPVGSSWPNPFSDNVTMVAVESGAGRVGQWVAHKRNVREDLKRYLGLDAKAIHAVALMVDADNTGKAAHSYYGDITFSSE
jgi:hypothetical protein